MEMYEFLEDIVKQLESCGYKTPDGLHDLKDSSAFHALKGMAILEKAAANNTKPAKYKDSMFLVFNKKHFINIPGGDFQIFQDSVEAILPHLPKNNYYVCNQDEPYAPRVLEIILKGEAAKEAAAAESARRV